MHPEIEHALARTSDQIGDQLKASDALRDFVHDVTRPWNGRELDREKHPHDVLIAALFARSFKSFWAAVELVRMGFGEQAAMLNRSLFEDMVDAHWICTEPERAMELYQRHHEHGRMLLAEQVAKYPDFYPELELPSFTAEERQELDKMFGKHGGRSWTTLSIHERVSAIESFWDDDGQKQILRFFRDIPHRENNQTLHVTALGLAAVVREHGPEGLTLSLGPGGEMLERSLYGAFWIFSQTLGLVLDHFSFEIDGKRREAVFGTTAFSPLSSEDLRGVGRNEPCPCGSGKKFKRCHGE